MPDRPVGSTAPSPGGGEAAEPARARGAESRGLAPPVVMRKMSMLSSVQIKEANAHLAAVHRRVTELEQRLDAAERTVREQAERLMGKDRELQAAVRELAQRKDR